MLKITEMLNTLAAWRRVQGDERGATAVEYGMIVALIAAVIILVVTALGLDVLAGFDAIENGLFGDDA